MTRHIFIEKTPGFVSHTAASKVLAENQLVQDFVGIQTEEKFKASAFVRYSCCDEACFLSTNGHADSRCSDQVEWRRNSKSDSVYRSETHHFKAVER